MRKTNDKDDLIVYDPAPVIEAIDRLTKKHGTETVAAELLGVSQSYFSNIRSGRRRPGFAILQALGMQAVITYRKAARD